MQIARTLGTLKKERATLLEAKKIKGNKYTKTSMLYLCNFLCKSKELCKCDMLFA